MGSSLSVIRVIFSQKVRFSVRYRSPQATRATIDVRATFFFVRLSYGLRSSPENRMRRKNKTVTADKTSHGLGTQQKIREKEKKWAISDDFGLRRTIIQKTFQTTKLSNLYRSHASEFSSDCRVPPQ